MNPQQVRAYLDANPGIRDSTAQWLRDQGERRDVYTWVLADMRDNPSSVHRQQMSAWQSGASATPDLPQNQLDALIAAAERGDANVIAQLEAAGYEQVPDTESLPLEQGLLQAVLPNVYTDIEGDAQRSELAQQLAQQSQEDYQQARNLLSPEESQRRLQEEYAMADQTASALSSSAATSAAQQIAAIQAATQAMQGSLQGELGARAAALAEQLAAVTANLDQYDESQRAILAQQVTEQAANLEQQIAAQRTALATELESLRGVVGEEATARQAALAAEIEGLTVAQEPLSAARLQTAESVATGINLALEGERDRLTAEGARRGYLGGSSFEDAAQLRATIGARQGAAQTMGQAREANATDTRTIQSRAATEGRSLADQLAANLRDVGTRGATGERSLADALAMGQRGIADYGTNSRATIGATTAQGQRAIGDAGATQQYQDRVFGATEGRALADALSRGTATISGTQATQQQQARDAGTTARQGYFDNAYARTLGGALQLPSLSNALTGALTNLDNYANSGTQRGLSTLSWWDTSRAAPPTPGYVPVNPSQSGNDTAGLGAGLTSAALSYGNSQNWWQKPAATTPATTSNQGTYGDSPYW